MRARMAEWAHHHRSRPSGYAVNPTLGVLHELVQIRWRTGPIS
jgi:hypothetical protein